MSEEDGDLERKECCVVKVCLGSEITTTHDDDDSRYCFFYS